MTDSPPFFTKVAALCVPAVLAGCGAVPAPPAARAAPQASAVSPIPATRPSEPSDADLRHTAESRRIQAFQRLREAQDAERSGRWTEARHLYTRSLELDPNNAAAADGRSRVIANLNEDDARPRRSRTEAQLLGSTRHVRFDFNTAIEEADKAVAAKQFAQARAAWRRARDAAVRQPGMFPPSQIEAFHTALLDLDRRIRAAESAEIEALGRAGRHAAAARIESQREADARDRAKTVVELVSEARRAIDREVYAAAGAAIDQILLLDPHNDFALGARPLLKKIGELERERRRLAPPATEPSGDAGSGIRRAPGKRDAVAHPS